ncbi:hypothetical protein LAZ67_4004049 [Cordylochernes scorpioides]|uniref:Endonuclease/exonuclease/phosphatase domain-containing protein n=1 Tax=Cordylochernes scorpioides TaxID=51811 RepID=A0ABY6KE68_9ARAC|nr:hypothetical protein LAZ67_4004049 [Cordylochernes scorpioides]
MNSDLYCDILVNKLKPGIRNKRRGKLSKGVLFLHDNARPHTSCKTVSTIIKLGFEVLEHPAYSPDLAPSDYFLFGLLKKELKGKRFDSDEDVQKVMQDFFHTLPKSAYKEGIYKLPERWRRCIESQGQFPSLKLVYLSPYAIPVLLGDNTEKFSMVLLTSKIYFHLTAIGRVPRWSIEERPSDMKASCKTNRITLTNKLLRTNSSIVRRGGYGGAASVLMLESAAKASASMLGTASNYRQSQTFTKMCLDHSAMINDSCTTTPHSMRSDVDLHAASPVAQNKQGRGQDLGRGFCPISIIQSPQTSHFAASKQLSILQCNINGLCSTATKIKLEEIMEIAEKQKIQIIALQETKLNEKYNLKYKNYNILRKDRNKEGGGLAFLIKNLYYEDIAINIPNTSDLEAQGIKVYLSKNKTINIFNMYHPPNNKLIDDGTMAQFLTDNTIIVGDLNAKHQLWGCSMPNPRGKILSNLFDDNAFMCLNDGNPTHHSYSYNTAQALDISFSSPDIFHKCKWQILKSIGSDHLPILIEISTKTKTSSIKEKFWNFTKANWNL